MLLSFRSSVLTVACAAFLSGTDAFGALAVNASQSITHKLTVQPIIVSNDDGSNTATFMGTSTQEGLIKGFIDDIYAQAGIDVDWLSANAWNDTFANVGTANPRPGADLGAMVSDGTADGVTHLDPLVLNVFFVQNPAGFSTGLSANQAAGLAYVGANGVSQYVGANLPSFTGGQETVASVIAHEIAHNLGLSHTPSALQENLMNGSGTTPVNGVDFDGQRLTQAQIDTILASQFTVLIPEPSSFALLGIGGGMLIRRRRV